MSELVSEDRRQREAQARSDAVFHRSATGLMVEFSEWEGRNDSNLRLAREYREAHPYTAEEEAAFAQAMEEGRQRHQDELLLQWLADTPKELRRLELAACSRWDRFRIEQGRARFHGAPAPLSEEEYRRRDAELANAAHHWRPELELLEPEEAYLAWLRSAGYERQADRLQDQWNEQGGRISKQEVRHGRTEQSNQ